MKKIKKEVFKGYNIYFLEEEYKMLAEKIIKKNLKK
ncbi:Uncharacterised protein [Fusobacterium varium]|nr:Uncharacterised protein [Fusobacterium varium]